MGKLKGVKRKGTKQCPGKLRENVHASAARGQSKATPGQPGWCFKGYVYCITTSITKNKVVMRCFSQACQTIYNPKIIEKSEDSQGKV